MKLIPRNIQWEVEQSTDGVMLSHQPIPTLYHLSLDLEFHPSKLQMLTGTDKLTDKVPKVYFSMTSRRKIGSFDQDLARTPGPAGYSVVDQNLYKKQQAKYSLLARRFCPGDKTRKPGPGTHYPEHVNINKQQVPRYSMGIKHSEYITPFI